MKLQQDTCFYCNIYRSQSKMKREMKHAAKYETQRGQIKLKNHICPDASSLLLFGLLDFFFHPQPYERSAHAKLICNRLERPALAQFFRCPSDQLGRQLDR